jgi:hypothetical protein
MAVRPLQELFVFMGRRIHMTTMQRSERKSEERATTDQVNRDGNSGCCGGPAPATSGACCAKDHAAKTSGASGCGCGSAAPARACC